MKIYKLTTRLNLLFILSILAFLWSCATNDNTNTPITTVFKIQAQVGSVAEVEKSKVIDDTDRVELQPNNTNKLVALFTSIVGSNPKISGVTYKVTPTLLDRAHGVVVNDNLGVYGIRIIPDVYTEQLDKTYTLSATIDNITKKREFTIKGITAIPVTGLSLTRKTGQTDTKAIAGTTTVDLKTVFDITVVPETATNKNVIWTINHSMDTIATLTPDGILTPISAGTVNIQVTSVSESSISSIIEAPFIIDSASSAVPIISLTLARKLGQTNTKAIAGGATVDLASVFDIIIVPNNATNKSIIWSLATTRDGVILPSGLLTPISAGTIKVIVTSSNDIKSTPTSFVIEVAPYSPYKIQAQIGALNSVISATALGDTDAVELNPNETDKLAAIFSVLDGNTQKTDGLVYSVSPDLPRREDGVLAISDSRGYAITITPSIYDEYSDEIYTLTVKIAGTPEVTKTRIFTIKGKTTVSVTGLTLSRKAGHTDTKGIAGDSAIDLKTVFDVTVAPQNATNKNVVWSIHPTKSSVATITDDGILTIIASGSVNIRVTSVSETDISSITEAPFVIDEATNSIAVTGLVLSRKTGQTETKARVRGGTVDLTTVFNVTVTPENATNKNVTWAIHPAINTIATLTLEGVLTPISTGTVNIKVTSVSDISVSSNSEIPFSIAPASTNVPLTRITLVRKTDQTDTKAIAGDTTVDLTTVFYAEFTPSNATNQNLCWAINPPKPSVAIITLDGKLRIIAAGTVNIQVISDADPNIFSRNNAPFIIETATTSVPVTSLALERKTSQNNTKALAGRNAVDLKKVFDVTVEPSTATNKNVTWSIHPAMNSVATLTSEGVLTPISAGTVNIRVTSVSKTSISSTLNTPFVIEPAGTNVPITKITLSYESNRNPKALLATNKINLENFFEYVIEPENATNKTVTWSIDPKVNDIAFISDSYSLTGEMSLLKVGKVSIKVSGPFGIHSNSLPFSIINYNPVPISQIILTRKSGQESTTGISGGTSVNLTTVFNYTVLPENATDKSVFWVVSPPNPTIANNYSLNGSNILIPVSAGKVFIKVQNSSSLKSSNVLPFTIEPTTASVPITSVELSKHQVPYVRAGGSTTNMTELLFYVKVNPVTASNPVFNWYIDPVDTSVATLSTAGVLTPISEGVVNIKVTASSSASTTIKSSNLLQLTIYPKITYKIQVKIGNDYADVGDTATPLRETDDVIINPKGVSQVAASFKVIESGNAKVVRSASFTIEPDLPTNGVNKFLNLVEAGLYLIKITSAEYTETTDRTFTMKVKVLTGKNYFIEERRFTIRGK